MKRCKAGETQVWVDLGLHRDPSHNKDTIPRQTKAITTGSKIPSARKCNINGQPHKRLPEQFNIASPKFSFPYWHGKVLDELTTHEAWNDWEAFGLQITILPTVNAFPFYFPVLSGPGDQTSGLAESKQAFTTEQCPRPFLDLSKTLHNSLQLQCKSFVYLLPNLLMFCDTIISIIIWKI